MVIFCFTLCQCLLQMLGMNKPKPELQQPSSFCDPKKHSLHHFCNGDTKSPLGAGAPRPAGTGSHEPLNILSFNTIAIRTAMAGKAFRSCWWCYVIINSTLWLLCFMPPWPVVSVLWWALSRYSSIQVENQDFATFSYPGRGFLSFLLHAQMHKILRVLLKLFVLLTVCHTYTHTCQDLENKLWSHRSIFWFC